MAGVATGVTADLRGVSGCGFTAFGLAGVSTGAVVSRLPIHHHTQPTTITSSTATATHLVVVRLLSPVAPTREGPRLSRPFPLLPSAIFVGEIPRFRHSAMQPARSTASTASSRNAPSLPRYVTVKVIFFCLVGRSPRDRRFIKKLKARPLTRTGSRLGRVTRPA